MINARMNTTYDIEETTIHPIEVGLDGLKERCSLLSYILEYNTSI